MAPEPKRVEDIRLGEKVRRQRNRLGMTLKEVAELSGLSPALISQVENNNITPPISTLLRISSALQVPIAYFFQDEGPLNRLYTITRVSEREHVYREGPSNTYFYEPLITQLGGRQMNPFFVRFTDVMPPENEMYRHQGEEFWYFLRGSVEFRLGEETIHFEAGDSLYFMANVPHGGRRLGEEEAEALAILYTGGGPGPENL